MKMVLWSSGEQRWARARTTYLGTSLSPARIKYNKWLNTCPAKLLTKLHVHLKGYQQSSNLQFQLFFYRKYRYILEWFMLKYSSYYHRLNAEEIYSINEASDGSNFFLSYKKIAYPTMNLLFKSFQCLGYTIPSRLQKIDKDEIYHWLNKKWQHFASPNYKCLYSRKKNISLV